MLLLSVSLVLLLHKIKKGVFDKGILPYSQLKSQLDSFKNESFAVIKIGMLGNAEVIQAIVEFIHSQNSTSEK